MSARQSNVGVRGENVFATAETLFEFGIDAPDRSPDARTACHAADAWARVRGERALCIGAGPTECLDMLPALASPYGDSIDFSLVCILQNVESNESSRAILASGSHLSHSHLCLRAGPDETAVTRSRRLGEFLQAHPGGVQLIVLPWELPASELLQLIGRILNREARRAGSRPGHSELRPIAETLDRRFARARRPLLVPAREYLIEAGPVALIDFARQHAVPVLLPAQSCTAPPTSLERLTRAWPRELALIPSPGVVGSYSLMRADLILSIGAPLGESELCGLRDFGLVPPEKVVAVSVDDFLSWSPGEPGRALLARRNRWQTRLRLRERRYRRLALQSARRSLGCSPASRQGDRFSGPRFDPAVISGQIVQAAPKNALFLAEGNGAGMWLWSYNRLRPTLYPDRMASIGLLLPWVLGADRAAPERPLWCFAGDGSLGYQTELFAELSRRQARAVIFVFNNSAWSSIRLEQSFLFQGRYPGTELPARNFAALAERQDCEGIRVDSPEEFRFALCRAKNPQRTGPLVVDIPMPADSIPFAGLNFALAELDYLAKPMLLPLFASAIRAALSGRFSPRIPRMLARMVLP